VTNSPVFTSCPGRPGCFLKSDVNVLVFKKLQGKFSSTAKYRLANKEDEEEKQDKEEEN